MSFLDKRKELNCAIKNGESRKKINNLLEEYKQELYSQGFDYETIKNKTYVCKIFINNIHENNSFAIKEAYKNKDNIIEIEIFDEEKCELIKMNIEDLNKRRNA